MNRSDLIHPDDDDALKKLEAVPGFGTLLKKFMSAGYEKMMYSQTMGSAVRLSPTQLPKLYNLLPPICQKLGIEEPEFYLEMCPFPNALTSGDTRVWISITSALVEYLDEEELISVIGHECGHILCRHVLYHQLANYLCFGAQFGLEATLGTLGTVATIPIRLALSTWYKKSELSADRAAALVTSPEVVCRTFAKLAGGPTSITSEMDMEEWAKQADEYEAIKNSSTWNKVLQKYATMGTSHPLHAVRVREILKWKESNQYKLLISNHSGNPGANNLSGCVHCPHCGQAVEKDWNFCKFCGSKI